MMASQELPAPRLGHLPPGATAAAIADDARQAALAFVNGSAFRWTKRDLADWLEGPYAAVTHNAGPRAHSVGGSDALPLRELDIAMVVRDARWHVLAQLEAAALPRAELSFSDRLFALGYVVPAWADDGIAWLPVDRARGGRLRTRVLSLFAADALARPRDYTETLFICHRCDLVVFDAVARRQGSCGHHDVETLRRTLTEHRATRPPPRDA
jgi:hypothetical protein